MIRLPYCLSPEGELRVSSSFCGDLLRYIRRPTMLRKVLPEQSLGDSPRIAGIWRNTAFVYSDLPELVA